MLSYDENYDMGPDCGSHKNGSFPRIRYLDSPRFEFLGRKLYIPFGIPAGPLLNAAYVRVALEAGVGLAVYKTVRSRLVRSHPWPNILSVNQNGPIEAFDRVVAEPITKQPYDSRSISNSFGVPSKAPKEWAEDFKSLQSDPKGQLVILSFQGSRADTFDSLLRDTVACAIAACEAARARQPDDTPILEINLSCPNEGGEPLYKDVVRTKAILSQVKKQVPAIHLIAKIGCLSESETAVFVGECHDLLSGVSAINTVPVYFLKPDNVTPALGADRLSGGLCGEKIYEHGLRQVQFLTSARKRWNISPYKFPIVAVGGVIGVGHFDAYRNAGADVVLAASGAMWNLELVQSISQRVGVSFEVVSERNHSSVL